MTMNHSLRKILISLATIALVAPSAGAKPGPVDGKYTIRCPGGSMTLGARTIRYGPTSFNRALLKPMTIKANRVRISKQATADFVSAITSFIIHSKATVRVSGPSYIQLDRWSISGETSRPLKFNITGTYAGKPISGDVTSTVSACFYHSGTSRVLCMNYDFSGTVGGLPVSGNFKLRYHTKLKSTVVADGAIEPIPGADGQGWNNHSSHDQAKLASTGQVK